MPDDPWPASGPSPHVKRRRRLPSRHFGDTANSDVTVAFSGTAVTVLMALAPEGE